MKGGLSMKWGFIAVALIGIVAIAGVASTSWYSQTYFYGDVYIEEGNCVCIYEDSGIIDIGVWKYDTTTRKYKFVEWIPSRCYGTKITVHFLRYKGGE
jgi:hypothetical protein